MVAKVRRISESSQAVHLSGGNGEFYDAAGDHLFTIRNEFLHPHTFVAFDPVFDQPLFTITQRSWRLHIEFDMCVIMFSVCYRRAIDVKL